MNVILNLPFQGYKSAVIQDVPISKPLSRSDVMELQSALDMAQDIPQVLTINLCPLIS